jgi:hypothetical protein
MNQEKPYFEKSGFYVLGGEMDNTLGVLPAAV